MQSPLLPSSSWGKFFQVASETVWTLIGPSAISKPALSTWGKLLGTSDHIGYMGKLALHLGTAGIDSLAVG